MQLQLAEASVQILAPAKINLFLEILARRDDGFHELETLMTAIDIYDTIRFARTHEESIQLECTQASGWRARSVDQNWSGDVPTGERNIAWRAARQLQLAAGVRWGARIQLHKRIPSQAGLGGASSDAAAVLLAANHAWGLHWSRERLRAVAAGLGSDVPFFLWGGYAVCRGRGEEIEPLAGGMRLHAVLVRPRQGLSTPEVFRCCRPGTPPADSGPLRAALAEARPDRIAALLHNRLQAPAESLAPELHRLRQDFERTDCLGHQLSGSGTSYFGLCRTACHARRVAGRLRARGWDLVFQARTID